LKRNRGITLQALDWTSSFHKCGCPLFAFMFYTDGR
jgi:hypothetical protein